MGCRFRVQGAGCRLQVAGCRVQGAGCRVQGDLAAANVGLAADLDREVAGGFELVHVL